MHSNDFSDCVFDSLVEEMISDRHPPDLSSRILAAVQSDQQRSLLSGSTPRYSWSWLAGLAVALLLGLTGWYWGFQRTGQGSRPKDSQLHAVQGVDSLKGEGSNANDLLATEAPASGKSSRGSTNPLKPRQTQSVETIEDLPFAIDSSRGSKNDVAQAATPAASIPKLTDAEVVAELDRLLAAMWDSMHVSPGNEMSADQQAQRIAVALTGKELTKEQLDEYLDSKRKSLKKSELVQFAVKSQEFRSHWSALWVQHWTGNSLGKAEKVLANSLEQRFSQQPAWNETVAELIGSDLQSDQSLSHQFLSLFAGGENQRLVECIGRAFMNQSVACMRCHRQPDAENISANQQAAYWSLITLLRGIEGRGPGRTVLDRQADIFSANDSRAQQADPGAYFELPNGTLQQALAQLPTGQPWSEFSSKNPRHALAQWIKNSNQFDQATVNSLWQMMFGRALLPQVSGIDTVALDSRRKILLFLAEQFDRSNHDTTKLLGWIVSSRAFSASPAQYGFDQFQRLEDSVLEQMQLAEWTFATGPQLTDKPLRNSIQDRLQQVVQWRAGQRPQTVLSQPLPSAVEASQDAQRVAPAQLGTERLWHGVRSTFAEQAYAERLLRAEKLTWTDRVEHILGVAGPMALNDDLHFRTKELLQQHSGDTKAALLDLLWIVQNNQL